MPGYLAQIDFLALFVLLVMGQQVIAGHFKIKAPKDIKKLPNEKIFRLLSLLLVSVGFMVQLKIVPMVLFIAGFATSFAGVALALWAQVVLGRNWVPGIGLYRNHKLVTRGPYRLVRHPIYTGISFLFFGGAIMCANPALFFAAVAMSLSLVIRFPLEEAALKKKFGKRWNQYEKSTGSFLPRFRQSPR